MSDPVIRTALEAALLAMTEIYDDAVRFGTATLSLPISRK
jgi:L-amino acid N-acyltransferase YncA